MRNGAHFFPVRMPPGARGIIMVPWDLMEMHGRQASSNHQGRSLEELQGSLDCSEICAVLDDRAWYPMDDALARLQVIAAIRGFDPPPSMISPSVEAAAIALLREHFGDNMTWAEAPEKMRNAWRKKAGTAIAAYCAIADQQPGAVVDIHDGHMSVNTP